MASRRSLILAVLLCASVAFLLFTLHAPRAPGRRRTGTARRASSTGQQRPSARAVPAAAPADVDFSRYEGLAKQSIFAPRGAKAPSAKNEKRAPVPSSQLPPIATPPERRLDLNGWSYLGYVVLDGNKVGILQQPSSGRCEYLPVGGTFLGAKVQDVNDRTIRFRLDSSESTLTRSRDFHVLPLERGPATAPVRPRPQQ